MIGYLLLLGLGYTAYSLVQATKEVKESLQHSSVHRLIKHHKIINELKIKSKHTR